MNTCPKCGASLPEEAHFCMHCFYSFDHSEPIRTPKKRFSSFQSFLKGRVFKGMLISVVAILLLCIGGIALKSAVHPVKKVSADEVAFIPVTQANGETVTDESGEMVTEQAVPVTDENGENITDESGEKIYQVVVPVTMENGESVTDRNGEQVYEIVTQKNDKSLSESTSKKSIFDFLFSKDDKTTKPDVSLTEPTASAQGPGTTHSENTTGGSASDTTYTTAATSAASTSTQQSTSVSQTSTTQTETQPKTSTSDFSYTESDGVLTITKYNGNDSYVTVPAYIEGKPVKHVGEDAFSNNSKIKTIFFESGNHFFQLFEYKTVFKNLPNLNEIIFPKNTSNLTLADSGNAYENFYFYKIIENCNNISGIYFGSKDNTTHGLLYSDGGVVYSRGYILAYYPPAKTDAYYAINPYCTTICGAAFRNNPYLTHLHISRDLKYISIGKDGKFYNFLGCTSLKEFSVDEKNTRYTVKNGVLYYRPDGTMNGITYYSFHYPPAKTDKYFETIDQPVIISHGFYGNPYIETIKLSNVYFQDVTQLRGNASSPVNLKKIILKAEPHWSYTQKLKEYGIEYEIAS